MVCSSEVVGLNSGPATYVGQEYSLSTFDSSTLEQYESSKYWLITEEHSYCCGMAEKLLKATFDHNTTDT